MNKTTTTLLLVLLGTFLFDFLFYAEKMGINVLLFALFFVAALVWIFPESRSSRGFLMTAGGTLLTAAMIGWHNSGAAKFAFFITAATAAGFAQSSGLRYILYAFDQYLVGLIRPPQHLLESLRASDLPKTQRFSFRKFTG